MIDLLLTQVRVGFMGLHGLIGFFVALIVFIIVAALLYRILALVMAKVGLDAGWQQIVYLFCLLVVILVFLQVAGIWVWAS